MINALVMSGVMVMSPAQFNGDEGCNLQLDHDLYASHESVSLKQGGDELWRIGADGSFYIGGQAQQVSDQTRQSLSDYQQGVYQQTIIVVDIMEEALGIASHALTATFGELLGERHKSVKRLERFGEDLRMEFETVAYHAEGQYVIKGSELDAFGDRLGNTIEAEVEAIVQDSMGSMLIMVGKAMLTGSGSMDDRMAQFEERMENFGSNLESEMETRAAVIESKAEHMCGEIQYIAHLEDEISAEVPAFAEFRLTDNMR